MVGLGELAETWASIDAGYPLSEATAANRTFSVTVSLAPRPVPTPASRAPQTLEF
jgi:hypothetical protein